MDQDERVTHRDEDVRLPAWAVAAIHLLFFFSGAAALIYEVVWMRMLSFVFGNTTYAVSVVLAVFLGGLAIGALLYGRVADRRPDLLRVYGLLEGGAALIALLLPFVLTELLTPFYTWIYRWAGESTAVLTVARLVLSAAVLVVPAILLGGTLPVLVRFVVRRDRDMEAHIGRLYGLNTLGAVGGSFAAGFLLMPALGLRSSNAFGAALGLTVAVVAFGVRRVLGRRAAPSLSWRPSVPLVAGAEFPDAARKWLLLAFALSGFAALAYEVLWTRMLVFLFDGTVFAFSAMLCVYLLGLAIGSLVYSLAISRSSRQLRWFVVLEVLIGLSGAASLGAFLLLPHVGLFKFQPGFWSEVGWIFVAALLVMAVPTILIGAVFPLVSGLWARATGRIGSGVGEVYVVNTLGTVTGSLATGFILIPALGTPRSLFLVAGLNICAGLVVWAAVSRAGQRPARALGAFAVPVVFALALGQVVTGEDMVRALRNRPNTEIEWVREGIDGTVTIERVKPVQKALAGPGDPRVLAINGINVAGTLFELQTTQRLQAHLAMLIHPDPKSIMHIGFGSGGTAYSLSQYPIERVDAVEISKSVLEAASRLPETSRGVLDDPRVHVFVEDARTFVKHTPRKYDLILSDLAHPTLAGQGFFYSVDYLRDCRERLAPGGFFSTWTPIHGLRLNDLKVLVRSIQTVFPYVYIWHSAGGRNQFCVIHGMTAPLRIDYPSFATRMAIPGVAEDLAWIGLRAPEEVLALLLRDHDSVREWLSDGEQVNTDDNGYMEFVAARRLRELPAARRVHFMITYPDLVLAASGSAVEYASGGRTASVEWRQEFAQQRAANRLVLIGRLYELPRADEYHLLAAVRYRRALELVPDHFIAQAMLGLTERQLEEVQSMASAGRPHPRAIEDWLGALVAAGRLEEAVQWARQFGSGQPWSRSVLALLGVLRERPEEVRRLLERPLDSDAGRRPPAVPISGRTVGEAAAALERARERPRDPRAWLDLGNAYRSVAAELKAHAFRPPETTQGELIGLLRSVRLQAVVTLMEMAASSYQEAVSLAGDDPTAIYALAAARTSLADYSEAIELVDRISEPPLDRDGVPVPLTRVRSETAALRDLEQAPFAFLSNIRAGLHAPSRWPSS